MTDLFIVGYRTTDGKCQLLGYTKNKLSVKQLRRVLSPYRKNADFVNEFQMDWVRFYRQKDEVRRELLEIF